MYAYIGLPLAISKLMKSKVKMKMLCKVFIILCLLNTITLTSFENFNIISNSHFSTAEFLSSYESANIFTVNEFSMLSFNGNSSVLATEKEFLHVRGMKVGSLFVLSHYSSAYARLEIHESINMRDLNFDRIFSNGLFIVWNLESEK